MSTDGVIQHDVSNPGADAAHKLWSDVHFQLHFLVRQGVESIEQFDLLFGSELTRHLNFHYWNSFFQGFADILNHAHVSSSHVPDVAGHFFNELIVDFRRYDIAQGFIADVDDRFHQLVLQTLDVYFLLLARSAIASIMIDSAS